MIEENTDLFCPISDSGPSLHTLPLKGSSPWHLNSSLSEDARTPLVALPRKEKVSSLTGGDEPAWSPRARAAQQADAGPDPRTGEAVLS